VQEDHSRPTAAVYDVQTHVMGAHETPAGRVVTLDVARMPGSEQRRAERRRAEHERGTAGAAYAAPAVP
jgi:hypothetical protein